MITRSPRRRRRLAPRFTPLEPRRLLSFLVSSDGQDGSDFVGPDASQGNDGIVDLHLSLTGLSATSAIATINVTSYGVPGVETDPGVTPPFQWATAPNPDGYALAEYFQPAPAALTADLYLNPQIRELAPPAGTGTPVSLGGSTGPLGQLQNGDWLDVSVTYDNGAAPRSSSNSRTSPPPPLRCPRSRRPARSTARHSM